MNNRDIEWKKRKLEEIRRQLESGQLNALRELLPNHVIHDICQECQYDFRARLLTPLVIIFHMIGAGMSREGSFQSAWHQAGQSGQSGSLAKGRKRIPLEVWERVDEWMIRQIEQEQAGEDRWRGHRMLGVDGTCVSMSEEPELVEHFGRCRTKHGDSRFPVSRSLVIFNLKSLVTVCHGAASYTTAETALLRQLLPQLQRRDVLVMDRHFAGANLYAEYQKAGVEFINRAHGKLQIDRLKIVESFSAGDYLVGMPVGEAHRRKDTSLPKSIRVRLIRTEAKVRGKKEVFWLATSLLNPWQYPAQEIRMWYKKRWRMETLIKELKIWFGSDVLRSKTVQGIYKELYARVIALNLVHWLILKAACQYHRPAERLSVSATLRLTIAYSLKMSTAPGWQLPLLYDQLLCHIAFSTVPYRPDRIEPRMIKRETKHYDMLKISRAEWRSLHAMAA